MFPPDLAKLFVDRAGTRYVPSNGTEGEIFHSEWCENCARDSVMNGTRRDVDDCPPEELCTILAASFWTDEKENPDHEWKFGPDGQPMCASFVPVGQTIPPPKDTATLELFATKDTP